MKKIIKNDKGVSLVELLIVLAIATVLMGVAGIGMGLISTKSATQCAKNMQVSLDKNRTTVMGKKNGRIAFFKSGDGSIYMQEDINYGVAPFSPQIEKATKIGKNDVSVVYGESSQELTTSGIVVIFSRSGSVISGYENFPIVVSKRNKVYTINVEKVTGKVTVTQN